MLLTLSSSTVYRTAQTLSQTETYATSAIIHCIVGVLTERLRVLVIVAGIILGGCWILYPKWLSCLHVSEGEDAQPWGG